MDEGVGRVRAHCVRMADGKQCAANAVGRRYVRTGNGRRSAVNVAVRRFVRTGNRNHFAVNAVGRRFVRTGNERDVAANAVVVVADAVGAVTTGLSGRPVHYFPGCGCARAQLTRFAFRNHLSFIREF